MMYMGDHQLTGNDSALQTIDLSGDNITRTGGGDIRVDVTLQHSGLPCVAVDDTPTLTGMNWVKQTDGTWADLTGYMSTGNFIIRAEITY